jgi:hypothetical protein
MVKAADLNCIEVPEDREVLDTTALSRRLGFRHDTVLTYPSSERTICLVPRPHRQLAMRPIWYEKSVKEWQAEEQEGRARAKWERSGCKDYSRL